MLPTPGPGKFQEKFPFAFLGSSNPDSDYAAALAMPVPKWFLEPLYPSKISQTVLFSKPILLAGGKIAQIWAGSQFSPDFGHTNPRRPDAIWLISLRTPGQDGSVVVCQRKSGGYMHIPPPGMVRNSGSGFDPQICRS